jgi:2'-5' RNA ligase
MHDQTAIVLALPRAQVLFGAFRAAHIRTEAAKVSAHVTLLVPFVALDALSAELRERLAAFFAAQAPIALRFERLARFGDDVLYLTTEPAEPLDAMQRALLAQFGGAPEFPPGQHVFHLTLAHHAPNISDAEAAFRAAHARDVPASETARTALVYVRRGGVWRMDSGFPLRG